MAEHDRRGIGRLHWLLENDPNSAVGNVYDHIPVEVARHFLMSEKEVQIEVAQALIEELHDALVVLRNPTVVIHGLPQSPHGV